jgi:hypothetical protein
VPRSRLRPAVSAHRADQGWTLVPPARRGSKRSWLALANDDGVGASGRAR